MSRAQVLGRQWCRPHVCTVMMNSVGRAHLHCSAHLCTQVIAMSPVGNAFRERLRKFPSLVNCCTIDWWVEVTVTHHEVLQACGPLLFYP